MMADLRRSSSHLATKRSLIEQPEASTSSTAYSSSTNKAAAAAASSSHRPKPGNSPHKNDCGILPGE
eukprot:scaffold385_cov38-Cyclotella_meneghiniana.AAC.2